MNEPETIREILEETKTIAVIGLSDKPGRASLGVSKFMQQQGYRIIPVNPLARSVLGEQAYATLDDAYYALQGKIDLVNVFRAPEFVPEIVKDVMRLKIPRLWLQEGVCHEEAAGWAEAAGVKVVMDRCILKDRMAAGWGALTPRKVVSPF
jgi:predicted CoA-binding protein